MSTKDLESNDKEASPSGPSSGQQNAVPQQAGAVPQQARTVPQQEGTVPEYHTRIGDPGALGLFSFASTLLILSLYNLQARSIHHPNIVLGMAIFCGGIAMLLAGMWAFPRGDAFTATVFVSFGAFWLSYASFLIPGTGIVAAYVLESEYRSAFGIYLVTWGIVAIFLFAASLFRGDWGFASFLLFLAITLWILAGGAFVGSIGVIKAGGVFGCITSFIAYGWGLKLLFEAEDDPRFRVPLGT